jgi:hypothetical protein
LEPLYTLASILYIESFGYYEVEPYQIFGNSDREPYYGETVMFPATFVLGAEMYAVDPEDFNWRGFIHAGALLNVDEALGRDKPSLGPAQIRPETVQQLIDNDLLCLPWGGRTCYSASEDVGEWENERRLMTEDWAIEYAAANMVWATKQPTFNNVPSDVLSTWFKQAAWHNAGAEFDPKVSSFPTVYVGTLIRSAMEAIRGCDLLGIEGNGGCIG